MFSEWAAIGRDERMAKGHEIAVKNMLDYALKGKESFRIFAINTYLYTIATQSMYVSMYV